MDIKELAEQAGLDMTYPHCIEGGIEDLIRFAELVAAVEREACAKVCDEYHYEIGGSCKDAAAAIRARGDKHD